MMKRVGLVAADCQRDDLGPETRVADTSGVVVLVGPTNQRLCSAHVLESLVDRVLSSQRHLVRNAFGSAVRVAAFTLLERHCSALLFSMACHRSGRRCETRRSKTRNP